MEFISDYMRDDTYRHMLNGLTQKTFGFDFEGWVTNGYFEGDYIPFPMWKEELWYLMYLPIECVSDKMGPFITISR